MSKYYVLKNRILKVRKDTSNYCYKKVYEQYNLIVILLCITFHRILDHGMT